MFIDFIFFSYLIYVEQAVWIILIGDEFLNEFSHCSGKSDLNLYTNLTNNWCDIFGFDLSPKNSSDEVVRSRQKNKDNI